jgi:hypothetical protein
LKVWTTLEACVAFVFLSELIALRFTTSDLQNIFENIFK